MQVQPLQKTGKVFYGVAMSLIGIQQMFFGQFARLLFPTWAEHVPGIVVVAAIGSVLLIIAGLAIAFSKTPKTAALLLAMSLLLLFVFSYVPYNLFFFPAAKSFGIWTNALKELALSGGAFIIAGNETRSGRHPAAIPGLAERLVSAGPLFFAITMTSFGFMHFLYAEFVATLVPAWIPAPLFWTWFTGFLLMASGLAIAFRLKQQVVALWLAIMLFLWTVLLHIPRALADPFGDRGNEVVSAFTALAFCGIALAIAGKARPAVSPEKSAEALNGHSRSGFTSF